MLKLMTAAAALLAASAALAQNDASYSTHGMAMFGGKDAIYVSHLPMLHPPHDAQVVAKVRFEDKKLDASLRAQLDGKTALWTINPEKFELNRLAPGAAKPLQSFKADVVAGHFERGGVSKHAGVQLVVEEVIIYRKLSAGQRTSATSTYRPVGNFLVKEIDSRPDYDHIVLLRKPASAPVTVRKEGLREPVLPDAVGSVYFDTADLK